MTKHAGINLCFAGIVVAGLVVFGSVIGVIVKSERDSSKRHEDARAACAALNPHFGEQFVIKTPGFYTDVVFVADSIRYAYEAEGVRVHIYMSDDTSMLDFKCSDLKRL